MSVFRSEDRVPDCPSPFPAGLVVDAATSPATAYVGGWTTNTNPVGVFYPYFPCCNGGGGMNPGQLNRLIRATCGDEIAGAEAALAEQQAYADAQSGAVAGGGIY